MIFESESAIASKLLAEEIICIKICRLLLSESGKIIVIAVF
ncbi:MULTISPECIES: hypothetical protein [Nostocaceae]|nr:MULTISPECIES: hypothetical protein [Nostocaceae]